MALANRMKDARGFDGLTYLIECDEEKGIAGILVEGSTSVLAMDFTGKTVTYSSRFPSAYSGFGTGRASSGVYQE